jgi:hypothetical protein
MCRKSVANDGFIVSAETFLLIQVREVLPKITHFRAGVTPFAASLPFRSKDEPLAFVRIPQREILPCVFRLAPLRSMHNRAPHPRCELAKLVREDELQLSRAAITEQTILSSRQTFYPFDFLGGLVLLSGVAGGSI